MYAPPVIRLTRHGAGPRGGPERDGADSAADVEDLLKGNVYAVRYDRIAELVLTKKLDLL